MIKIGNTIYFNSTPDDQCELCGEIEELRPYGANGENICFKCGTKDKKTTLKQLDKALDNLIDSPPTPSN